MNLFGGNDLPDWHERQLLTICSIDLSNTGHQTTIQALAFICEAPWCVSCRSSSVPLHPAVGTTTLVPHKTQPSSRPEPIMLA